MRTTIHDIQNMKEHGKRIAMMTAYDYTSAQIADRAGIPILLVGDSLGMVVQGHPTTLPVTLDEMIYHTKAVVRGCQQALVVADMPFLTYADIDRAILSAGRFLQETGAQAVKLEGGFHMTTVISQLVELGIPVMGHIGFTPQSVHLLGTRVQGKSAERAAQLINSASELEQAGVFALVLELVPAELAGEISSRLKIPTIGIGAGPLCDGQVQVWHDILGLFTDFVPRHTRQYATLAETITAALRQYANDVQEGTFPTMEHSATMDQQVLQEALEMLW